MLLRRRQEPRSPPRPGDRKSWLPLLLLPQAMYSSIVHRVHRWRIVEAIVAASDRQPLDLELTKLRKCKETKTWNARSAGDHQSPKGGEKFTQAETFYGVYGSI